MVSNTAEPEDAAPREPEARLPTPKPSRWESLNSDIRMLIVTVAGTLIGGILLVMVVAIAIVVARSQGLGLGVPSEIVWTLLLIGGTTGTVTLAWLYRDRPQPYRGFRPIMIFGAVFTGFFATVMVLTLLGIAAGIKPK